MASFSTITKKTKTQQSTSSEKKFIAYLNEKVKMEAARRLAIPGSEGYSSTDEMLYLAEMLQRSFEPVDLEEPACPMTAHREDGPVLFRIAHHIIAQDSSYVCDHWVLIDMGQKVCKEAKLNQTV